jgi:hypothetical protein
MKPQRTQRAQRRGLERGCPHCKGSESSRAAKILECGGKRSATPLWLWARRGAKAPSPLSLCRRTPHRFGRGSAALCSLRSLWLNHSVCSDALWWAALGLQPRDPRGQLEQQRDQLPRGEPQQQLAGQQEQQPRVPVRPAPSSTSVPEGAKADPAAILSCGDNQPQANSRKEPPGVSSQNGVSVESSGRICVSSPIPGTDL